MAGAPRPGPLRLGPFRPVALAAVLVDPAGRDIARHAELRGTGTAPFVATPPLVAGVRTLSTPGLHQHPPDADWREDGFVAARPWVAAFRDVLVHSDCGLICTDDGARGGEAVADMLGQSAPSLHHYEHGDAGVTLLSAARPARLRGGWLSLLTFGADSLYHWTIDGIGRLAAADAAALAAAEGVLVPPWRSAAQADLFARTGLADTHRVRVVAADETLRVERLIVPWSIECDFTVGANHRPHPCLRPFFDRLAGPAPAVRGLRLYVDRSGGPNRRLRNEAAVIAALTPLGFVAARPETLSLAAQIALFARAAVIVAPHGAGLANIVYARPGCRLIELHASHWVNWCYRRLAASLDLGYDCVVGAVCSGQDGDHVNARDWTVPVAEIVAAVARTLAGSSGT